MPIRLQDDLRTVAPWRAVRLSGRGPLFVTTDDPAISRIGSNPAAIEFSLPTRVFHRVRAISNARRGESQGDAKRSRFAVGRGPGRVATLARGAEGQPKGAGRRS